MCASVKRHEEAFGWLKTVGGLRKTKLIGREKLAGQALMCFATYNLGRIGGLSGWWDAKHPWAEFRPEFGLHSARARGIDDGARPIDATGGTQPRKK